MLYSFYSVAEGESGPLRSEVLRLRKAVLSPLRAVSVLLKATPISIFAALICLVGWGAPVWGQAVDRAGGFGGVRSFGITSSYSPDSSRILIGEAEQRRTWTGGVEYTHLMHRGQRVRWDYEGSFLPFYMESDPTVVGNIYTSNGKSIFTRQAPVRVISLNHEPVGQQPVGFGQSVPLYEIFGRQNSNGVEFSPLGARISALPRWRVQPSFALDLGFVVSAHDIPVDDAENFNFMFAFGPGVQFYVTRLSSLRLEYIYRHISNAGLGYENPGVDQGVVRLTLSRHW